MNAARIEHSPRLQRVARLLEDGKEHSTLDIMIEASVCAVSACVSELRSNGYDIRCRRVGDVWYYRMEAGDALA